MNRRLCLKRLFAGAAALTAMPNASARLLDSAAVPVLEEIQDYNPLLFDFVLKRQLLSGKQKLPESIFHTRDFFLRSKT